MESTVPVERGRAYAWGVVAACLVCAAGFGMMNVFWFLGDYEGCERGLYYYRAATWGDGLFLSASAGAAVAWLRLSPRFKDTGTKRAVAAACLAAVIGAGIQASWLLNDDVQLNWTIPQPHMFNAAGWYHAVFFVVAFGFFAFLVVKYWVIGHQPGAPKTPDSHFLEIVIWFGVAGYLAMHVFDDHASVFGQPLACMISVALSVVAAAVFFAGRHKSAGEYLRKCVIAAPGTLFAYGLAMALAFPLGEPSYQVPLGFALMCLFASSITFPAQLGREEPACYMVMACSGLGLSMLSLHVSGAWSDIVSAGFPAGVSSCVIGILLFVVCPFSIRGAGELNGKMMAAGVGAVAAGFAWSLTFGNPIEVNADSAIEFALIASIPHWILTMAALGCVACRAKGNVEYVRAAEDSQACHAERRARTAHAQAVAYPQIAIMSFGVLSLLLFDMLKLHPTSLDVLADFDALMTAPSHVVVLVCAVLIAGLAACVIGQREGGWPAVLGAVLVMVAYSFAFYYVTGLRRPLALEWWYAWSLFAPIGAALLVGEAFVSDCFLIRNRPYNSGMLLIAVILALGSYLMSMGCIIPTVGESGIFFSAIWSPGVGMLGAIIANVVIPVLCAMGVDAVLPSTEEHLVLNTPVEGVFQNGMAATVGVMLLGVLPMVLYANAPIAMLALVSFTPLAVTKIGKIVFPLAMNVKHLKSRIEDYEKREVDVDAALRELRSLSRHLQRQGVITMTVLLPWVLFVFFFGWLAWKWKRSRGTYRDYLWHEYLLRFPSRETVMLFVELASGADEEYASHLDILADQGIEAVHASES